MSRPIICAETLEQFQSIAECAECLGHYRYKSNIRMALTNPKRRNKAYGYHFYYIDSEMGQLLLARLKEREGATI